MYVHWKCIRSPVYQKRPANICCTLYMKSYRVSRNYYNILGNDSCYYQGRPQDLGGGGPRIFFQIWEFVCREAMRIARGVRGHAPPRKIFKTVQFGAFQGVF